MAMMTVAIPLTAAPELRRSTTEQTVAKRPDPPPSSCPTTSPPPLFPVAVKTRARLPTKTKRDPPGLAAATGGASPAAETKLEPDPPPASAASPAALPRCASAPSLPGAVRYRIGDARVRRAHSLPFQSASQADILLTRLLLNSPLFVKRTDGQWTYSVLVGRLDDGQGGASLICVMDRSGEVKKTVCRRYWTSCVRLVNDRAVDRSRPAPGHEAGETSMTAASSTATVASWRATDGPSISAHRDGQETKCDPILQEVERCESAPLTLRRLSSVPEPEKSPAVNLHARNFHGSRRERMRPDLQRERRRES